MCLQSSVFIHYSVGSYAILLECWKEESEERPDFSNLVVTISLTLEAVVGYMDFSPRTKDDPPCLLAAKVEVKTRMDGSSGNEGGGRQDTAV